MNSAVIAALISGAATILVTIITVITTNSRTRAEIKTQLALQDERQGHITRQLEELGTEVKAHNEYGRKIPVLEEQIKVINHRLDDLERGGAK